MSTNAPTAVPALEPALRGLLGDRLAAGDASYAVDGVVPALVARPRSTNDLAAALAAATEHGAAVIPWGGGRHMALGSVPARYDLALCTGALDRVVEHEPADLTVTVEGGITFARLQAVLGERGQFLPIDAPPEATVGGVLAAGVSGPSRHAYGLPRDWLLGCRVAHPDGSISKGGGRVVKNVAGYDMPKLAVGALGTLGVIVEASFKVAPLATAQETFLAACPSLEAAHALVLAADERGLALRAVAVLHGVSDALEVPPAGAVAACWLAGPAAAVERTAREVAGLAGGAETVVLKGEASERWWAALGALCAPEGGVTLKASLPPSAATGFVRSLTAASRQAASPASVSYPTTGLVLSIFPPADSGAAVLIVEAARRIASECGGSLVVLEAPVAAKERLDVWGDAGGALELMRRLKGQFDPRGTLNPGRFVGRL